MSKKLAILFACAAVTAPCGTAIARGNHGGSNQSSGSSASSSSSSSSTSGSTGGTAYYVSPTGSDSNNGLSATSPFLTLEHANSAMINSSIKTTYLMGGTFHRTSALVLNNSQAAGESWLAYPGQTPILDGGGKVTQGIYVYGVNNITIRWLTIQNYTQEGIWIQSASGALIDSNTVQNITSSAWSEGGIVGVGSFTSSTISHNLVKNTGYDGIDIQVPSGTSDSNLTISYNAVYTVCTIVYDCGAIHTNDYGHISSGIVINNNVLGGFSGESQNSKGIYLDDMASYTTVENNIIYGPGYYALTIHGGNNNTLENNIWDISNDLKLALYQYYSGNMAGNTFTCNVVYSSASVVPVSLWDVLGSGIVPTDTRNIYWKTVGTLPNLGAVVDSQPLVENPNFVSPSAANYSTNLANPGACGFKAISTSTVGPLAH